LKILANLFGPHADNLQASLNSTSRRHGLLLGNLANVSTPGFKRQDSDFSIVVNGARADEQSVVLRTTDPRHLSSSRRTEGDAGHQADRDIRSIRADGSSVDLETEVAALTETQLHYSALSMLARRYFQGLRETIREGR
jgi:flagellar basal-body rod protein FlgB